MGRKQKPFYGLRVVLPTGDEGEVLPYQVVRVSEVISKTMPKDALTGWAYNTGLQAGMDLNSKGLNLSNFDLEQVKAMAKDYGYTPWAKRDKAGDRGTEAHTVLEHLAQKVEPREIARDVAGMDPEVRGYAEAVMAWYAEADRFIVHSELSMVSLKAGCLPFAGTTDMIRGRTTLTLLENGGEMENSLGISDLKTSKTVYESHAVQLGAYQLMYEEMFPGTRIKWGSILLARADGTWEEVDVKPDPDYFLALLEVYRIKEGL